MTREPWVFLMRIDDETTFEQICERAAARLRHEATLYRVENTVLSYGGDQIAVLTYNITTKGR